MRQNGIARGLAGCPGRTMFGGLLICIASVDPLLGGTPIVPPTITGMTNLDSLGGYTSNIASNLCVNGNYLYCSTTFGGGLKTLDVTDPTNMTLTSAWSDGGGGSGQAYGLVIKGTTLYMANWAPNIGLRVFDISDPAHPSLTTTKSTTVHAWQFSLNGNLLFISVSNGYDVAGIDIWDVSTPSSPVFKSFLQSTHRLVGRPASTGNYLYTISNYWMQVYNISNPTSPSFVRALTFNARTGTGQLAIQNGYLYMRADDDISQNWLDGGLYVFSLTDPSNPQQVAFSERELGKDLNVHDRYGIIPAGGNGVYDIDVSDPLNPYQLWHVALSWPNTGPSGYPNGAAGAGNYEYISNVQANNCTQCGGRVFSLQVENTVAPVIDEVVPDPDSAFPNVQYKEQLTASATATWSLLTGPTGATVNSGTGLVSGWTPTTSNIGSTYSFNVQATNNGGSDTEAWSVRVDRGPSIDLGTTNVNRWLTNSTPTDGISTPANIGGRDCRTNVDPATDLQLYFRVDDNYAYQGNRPEIWFTYSYYDTGTGSIKLQYETSTNTIALAGEQFLTNSNTLKQVSYHVTDAYFGNGESGASDFRIRKVGVDHIYIDVVEISAMDPTATADLGTTDVFSWMTHPQPGDGHTTATTIGSKNCKTNTTPGTDNYFYFAVDDTFAYQGNEIDFYVTISYYDTGSGSLKLQYDSVTSSSTFGGEITLTGSNTWKTYSFHVPDAYFGNRQNSGADFRINKTGGGSFYIDTVSVSKVAPASAPPGLPTSPSPAVGATGVSTTPTLSWTAASGATSHDISFGTGNPPPFATSQSGTTYSPGTLSSNTTYYWRIGEENANGSSVGPIWSFSTSNLPGQATGPNPANTATGVDKNIDLTWTAGSNATSHDVYFGTTSPGTFKGNQTATTYDPGTMTANTVYYWRIDEKNANGTTTGTVWSFTTLPVPGAASGPDPVDAATLVDKNADLHWTAGSNATSHDVRFGTSNPPAFIQNQTGTTYDPGVLTPNTLYYWRIDEKNVNGTTTGTVWSFTVLPLPGAASSPSPANGATGVDKNADLSWTTGNNTDSNDVYFSTSNPPAFVQNQAGTTYDPGTLTPNTTYYWRIDDVNTSGTTIGTVWSFTVLPLPGSASSPSPANGATGVSKTATLSWTAGSNATSHDVYFGTSSPGTFQGNQAGTTFNPGTMTAGTTYYWRIDEKNGSGITTGTAWSFTVLPLPGSASSPSPANAATGVSKTATLSWTAGSNATSHDVYFGTSSPGTFQGNQTGTTFNPGTMTPGTTYYWRIDEKNGSGTTTGTVWSFTVLPLPGLATNPDPHDGWVNQANSLTLSWAAGSNTTSYDVYFGTSSPGTFQGNQTGTTFATGTLSYSTAYYWRIDPVNASGTTTGTVWSFHVRSNNRVTANLGDTDSFINMTHPQPGDGDTTPTTIGGVNCKTNVNTSQDLYFYFGVDNSWAYQGSKPDLYITLEYYDTGSGTIKLQYDATGGAYTNASSITLANDNTWKQYTWHVTDAYLGNRENSSSDLRIVKPGGGSFYVDRVFISPDAP